MHIEFCKWVLWATQITYNSAMYYALGWIRSSWNIEKASIYIVYLCVVKPMECLSHGIKKNQPNLMKLSMTDTLVYPDRGTNYR